jgi:hypothetical protein
MLPIFKWNGRSGNFLTLEESMENFEPVIIAFVCNWCTYTAADLAGTSRLSYPKNVRLIRVMCTGMVDPSTSSRPFWKAPTACWSAAATRRLPLHQRQLQGPPAHQTAQGNPAPVRFRARAAATDLDRRQRRHSICRNHARLPMKSMAMPTLVTAADQLEGVDPLSPAFPMNGAKVLAKLTRRPSGGKIAAIMRPCEIRAFIELVKLKQARTEDVVLIGLDCLGAFRNTDYFRFAGDDAAAATQRFYEAVLAGKDAAMDGADLTPACKACEHSIPDSADIALGLWGVDTSAGILAQAQSPAGEALLAQLNLPTAEVPKAREDALAQLA